MKKVLLTLLFVTAMLGLKAQMYVAKDGATNIRFISETPVEIIEAANKEANVVLNTKIGQVVVNITIKNFKFKNRLMEEYFNKNYMESERFPRSIFDGRINEIIDYSKEGENKVSVTGRLQLHGVEKPRTLTGTLTCIKNKDVMEFKLNCKFKIRLADHNIEVPLAAERNIAKEVDVTFESTLAPDVKSNK